MRHTVRALTCAGVFACTLVTLATAQVEFTNNFKFNSGQSVQPIFEGWSRVGDGSFNLHFGYLNRNYVEQPNIPIGIHNQLEPGGPDRGQPTYFYPRTHRNLFTVNVPSDWDRKREVIWTVTVNGKTERAFGWLQPEWEIDPAGGASGGGKTDPESLKNTPPTLSIHAVAPIKLPAKASLAAAVRDDGLPKPKPPAKRAAGQESPPSLQGGGDAPVNVPQVRTGPTPGAVGTPDEAPGLRVSWMVWRGPADAIFEPRAAQPKDGNAVSSVTFTKPGAYMLRATVTDGDASVSKLIDVVVQ